VRVNDPERGEGNIGYELAPAYWGHGYATEAARGVLAFGFDRLGLHRIWAECVTENVASAHVLEKLGMRREGYFRDHAYFKGRWWDSLLNAVLDHEWHGPAEGGVTGNGPWSVAAPCLGNTLCGASSLIRDRSRVHPAEGANR